MFLLEFVSLLLFLIVVFLLLGASTIDCCSSVVVVIIVVRVVSSSGCSFASSKARVLGGWVFGLWCSRTREPRVSFQHDERAVELPSDTLLAEFHAGCASQEPALPHR